MDRQTSAPADFNTCNDLMETEGGLARHATANDCGDNSLENEMRTRIKKYFFQITRGCGDPTCTSAYCASNAAAEKRESSAAAVMAVELAREGDAYLCAARLTLQPLQALMDQAKLKNDFGAVCLVVSLIFSSPAALTRSFVLSAPDVDQSGLTVDIDTAHQAMELLSDMCTIESSVQSTLQTALQKYVGQLEGISKAELHKLVEENPSWLNHFAVVLELRVLIDPDFHEPVLATLSQCIVNLPADGKARLSLFYRHRGARSVRQTVAVFQHFITMRILKQQAMSADYLPNKDDMICNAVQCLAVLYEANESAARPILPPEEFYNDAVNENIDLRTDFPLWTTGSGFSFCQYPFILCPAVKSEVLKVENVVKMRHEMQDAFFRAIFVGPTDPYLVLRIRREYLIRDALAQLSLKSKVDLKKQLRVQFIGEEGVDEGGVQKEFFQLAVREIFDPKYGMFVYNEETRFFWINPDSSHLGNEAEFELIGQILGLAIYNGVILDVHFPMVIYRKLMGQEPTLADVMESHPQLGRGLQQLANFEGNVEEVYQRTFQIEFDCFEMKNVVDLKPNGSNIALTNENRHEYIELYVDWLLNKSVAEQFKAFKRGFDNVAASNALKLFRPEEVELLVCGCPDLDFHALEQSTVYDGGFTKDSAVIKNFWSVVHEFTHEQKKRLLFFATGSDRVPIGGLSKLNFVIAQNGTDSDRLPTAHTCFNVLLLCEYSTKEKLRNRLLTAIQNAEGFGLI